VGRREGRESISKKRESGGGRRGETAKAKARSSCHTAL